MTHHRCSRYLFVFVVPAVIMITHDHDQLHSHVKQLFPSPSCLTAGLAKLSGSHRTQNLDCARPHSSAARTCARAHTSARGAHAWRARARTQAHAVRTLGHAHEHTHYTRTHKRIVHSAVLQLWPFLKQHTLLLLHLPSG